jgi:S-adenosylmethionine uptake transporter
MMRNFFALIFLLAFVFKKIDRVIRTKNLTMHLIRGVVGLCGMLLWFYVITLIPLSEAVSITFIVPIITTVAAIIFLKEKVHKKVWLSLCIGFIGVLIIIRPGFRDLNIAYLLALLTPFIWSISSILIKKMVATEKPETITLYVSFIMFVLSIPVAAPYLKPIPVIDLLWFAAIGLLSNFSYIANAICYSKVDVSVVQPFDFSRLIFTAIIAYLAFGESIDLIMIIGALVILSASIMVIPRKSKFARYREKVIKRRKLRILPIDD